jgi:hypothetical protein
VETKQSNKHIAQLQIVISREESTKKRNVKKGRRTKDEKVGWLFVIKAVQKPQTQARQDNSGKAKQR